MALVDERARRCRGHAPTARRAAGAAWRCRGRCATQSTQPARSPPTSAIHGASRARIVDSAKSATIRATSASKLDVPAVLAARRARRGARRSSRGRRARGARSTTIGRRRAGSSASRGRVASPRRGVAAGSSASVEQRADLRRRARGRARRRSRCPVGASDAPAAGVVAVSGSRATSPSRSSRASRRLRKPASMSSSRRRSPTLGDLAADRARRARAPRPASARCRSKPSRRTPMRARVEAVEGADGGDAVFAGHRLSVSTMSLLQLTNLGGDLEPGR